MKIIQSPEQYSSAFVDAVFQIAALPEELVEVSVYDNSDKTIIGKKRFSGSSTYDVNVSNYAKQQLDVAPLFASSLQFVRPEKRAILVTIRSGEVSGTVWLHGGTSVYPSLKQLSASPSLQVISPTQRSELALLGDDSTLSAEIVVSGKKKSNTLEIGNLINPWGIASLCLNMPDLATKLCSAGKGELNEYDHMEVRMSGSGSYFFSQHYQIVPDNAENVRLCWWNSYGQIDYYTMKRATQKQVHVDKQRIYTANGYRTSCSKVEHRTTLISGFILREEIEWLCEVITSPRVWIDQGDAFLPIEVLSDEIKLDAETLLQLEIEITPRNRAIPQIL